LDDFILRQAFFHTFFNRTVENFHSAFMFFSFFVARVVSKMRMPLVLFPFDETSVHRENIFAAAQLSSRCFAFLRHDNIQAAL
jgi:hypothetical protein